MRALRRANWVAMVAKVASLAMAGFLVAVIVGSGAAGAHLTAAHETIAAAPQLSVAAAAANEILIFEPTDSIELQQAVTNAGFVPVVISAAGWSELTTADFRQYRALLIGDPSCGGVDQVDAAVANRSVWGAAVDGNVIIDGTDAVFHGKDLLLDAAVRFASASADRTGAYVSLSCYYDNAEPMTPVPLLDAFEPGGFTATGVGCFDDAHIVADHPALSGISDEYLSGWGCSVHEAFDSWPDDFLVLAIARNAGSSYTAPDGTVGTPYILARGEGLSVISNITASTAATDSSIGTSRTVSATIVEDGVPQAGKTVTFRVISGPHAGTQGTAVTDGTGTAAFSYTGTTVGTDAIEASYVDSSEATQTSNRLFVTWVVPTPGPPELSIDDVTVAEGNAGTVTAVFTVSRSGGTGASSVAWATENGSASAGSDYTGASGSVSFEGEETAQTISVSVLGDTDGETDESFFVNLTEPTGATLADSQGRGTIVNDDAAPVLLADVSVTKTDSADPVSTGSQLTYTLAVTNHGPAVAQGVTVTDALPAGVTFGSASSTAGSCSGSATVTCTIGSLGANAVATVTIVVVPQVTGTLTNTATVATTSTDPDALDNSSSAQTTVVEPTVGAPTVTIESSNAIEGNSGTTPMTFQLSRSSSTGTSVVDYATSDGTATAGADYQAGSGTVTFADGESSKSITVNVLGETTDEQDETFTVTLTGETNASVGEPATGTILDDDTSGAPPTTPPTTQNAPVTTVFAPAPPPEEPGTFSAQPVAGIVLFNGRRIEGTITLVSGDVIDATNGTIEIVTDSGRAQFFDGAFKLTQPDAANAVTRIELVGGDFGVCGARKTSSARADDKPIRKLWGKGTGKFETKARYSAATVRGTTWLTADYCDRSLVRSEEGTVSAYDFSLRRTQLLPAGNEYFAEPPPPPSPGNFVGEVKGQVIVNGVPLEQDAQIRSGDTIDVRNGRIQLTTTSGEASFFSGRFLVTQTGDSSSYTLLTLVGGDFSSCADRKSRKLSGSVKDPPKKQVRSLWGNGTGKFRTKSRFSAATVRGTNWLSIDRCEGSLTVVYEGVVDVYDATLDRTVEVSAGQRYLAVAKR